MIVHPSCEVLLRGPLRQADYVIYFEDCLGVLTHMSLAVLNSALKRRGSDKYLLRVFPARRLFVGIGNLYGRASSEG